MWLETYVKSAFQPRVPLTFRNIPNALTLPETFRTLWEESWNEDLAAYDITNLYACYRQHAIY